MDFLGTIEKQLKKFYELGYNNKQILASAISGYEPSGPFSSARSDEYYDSCDTLLQKFEHIRGYADGYYSIQLTGQEILDIEKFLQDNFDGESERYFAFQDLNKDDETIEI